MSGLNLQEKLIQAKAVMDKVDGKSSTHSNQINSNSGSNPNLPPVSNNFNTQSINNVIDTNTKLSTPPKITEEKVNSSNLPDAIKKLMIDHPIPEVSFGNQIPSSVIEGAAEKMKSLGGIPTTSTRPTKNNASSNTKQHNKSQKLTQSGLKSLIRETIKDSLGTLIDEAISERLTESKNVNESIKIVVGSTVFAGKISSTKNLN